MRQGFAERRQPGRALHLGVDSGMRRRGGASNAAVAPAAASLSKSRRDGCATVSKVELGSIGVIVPRVVAGGRCRALLRFGGILAWRGNELSEGRCSPSVRDILFPEREVALDAIIQTESCIAHFPCSSLSLRSPPSLVAPRALSFSVDALQPAIVPVGSLGRFARERRRDSHTQNQTHHLASWRRRFSSRQRCAALPAQFADVVA